MTAWRKTWLPLCAGAALLGAAAPAAADYFSFQGEIQFQSGSDPFCSALTAGSFKVLIFGRNDGPRGIEAYLYGEQLLHAHLRGANPSQLALTYLGESSAGQSMRLRSTGVGAFAGDLTGKPVLAALYGCPFAHAQIQIAKTAGNDQATFQNAELQFQGDLHALQFVQLGAQGKVKEAIAGLQQATDAKVKGYGATHPQMLPYDFFLAQLHISEGSYPAAVTLYKAAANICEKAYGPDSACSGALLVGLGTALANNGVYGDAETALRRSLAIGEKFFGPDAPLRGQALNPLSSVLMFTGRYGEAETVLTQALSLNERGAPKDNVNVGISLNNFGILFRLTGQYKKAETYLRRAVAVDTKATGAEAPITILANVMLADVLRAARQDAAAEPIARHALTAAVKVLGAERQDHPALGAAQCGLAEILRDTGHFAEAEPLYRQALANSTKYLGPDHPAVATIELLLAKLLHATGRDSEALALLSHADRVAHLANNEMVAWQVAGQLLQIYAKGPLENRFKAIYYGKEAVNDLQKLRGNLASSSSETQQSFVDSADVSAIYRTLSGLLISDGRPAEAQQVHAMVKEQEFYDFTQRSADKDAPKTVATLTRSEKQLDELNGKYVAAGKEYAELTAKSRSLGDTMSAADKARLETVRKIMQAAKQDFDVKVDEIGRTENSPAAAKRRKDEINAYARSFQGTLKGMGHDAVVLQYIVVDDKIVILFVSPSSLDVQESKIKREDLDEQVRAFRKTLSSPTLDPVPQAQALYRLLVAPVAADLRVAGAKTLMLDLDDVLRYLPFAALHDGTNYLVDHYAISMVTEAVRDKLGAQPKDDWTVWGLGLTKGGAGYEALPYVDVELNSIAGDKGILKGTLKLDKAFTEDALQTGTERSIPVIHIASHFQFTQGSMDDSFLLLGDGRKMSLADFKTKLNLTSVELLTLSACETAVGDEGSVNAGAEVEGLGAIAQQAGAKAVLATLWPVADVSTAALMRALYQAHATDHLDKADALRQAQLSLLHGTAPTLDDSKVRRGLTRSGATTELATFVADPKAPFAHPFFWAPFILMGNWL